MACLGLWETTSTHAAVRLLGRGCQELVIASAAKAIQNPDAERLWIASLRSQ